MEEKKETRKKELKELKNQKRVKNDRKKRKKKEKREQCEEIDAILQTCTRVLERLKRVDDMNLRCYMLLEKFATMLDVVITTTVLSDLPEESRVKINFYFDDVHKETQTVMDWVINERQVPGSEELANPIPESDSNSNSSRRR